MPTIAVYLKDDEFVRLAKLAKDGETASDAARRIIRERLERPKA